MAIRAVDGKRMPGSILRVGMRNVLSHAAKASLGRRNVGQVGRQIIGTYGARTIGINPGDGQRLLQLTEIKDVIVAPDMMLSLISGTSQTLAVIVGSRQIALSQAETALLTQDIKEACRYLSPRDLGILTAEYYCRNCSAPDVDKYIDFLELAGQVLAVEKERQIPWADDQYYVGASFALVDSLSQLSRFISLTAQKLALDEENQLEYLAGIIICLTPADNVKTVAVFTTRLAKEIKLSEAKTAELLVNISAGNNYFGQEKVDAFIAEVAKASNYNKAQALLFLEALNINAALPFAEFAQLLGIDVVELVLELLMKSGKPVSAMATYLPDQILDLDTVARVIKQEGCDNDKLAQLILAFAVNKEKAAPREREDHAYDVPQVDRVEIGRTVARILNLMGLVGDQKKSVLIKIMEQSDKVGDFLAGFALENKMNRSKLAKLLAKFSEAVDLAKDVVAEPSQILGSIAQGIVLKMAYGEQETFGFFAEIVRALKYDEAQAAAFIYGVASIAYQQRKAAGIGSLPSRARGLTKGDRDFCDFVNSSVENRSGRMAGLMSATRQWSDSVIMLNFSFAQRACLAFGFKGAQAKKYFIEFIRQAEPEDFNGEDAAFYVTLTVKAMGFEATKTLDLAVEVAKNIGYSELTAAGYVQEIVNLLKLSEANIPAFYRDFAAAMGYAQHQKAEYLMKLLGSADSLVHYLEKIRPTKEEAEKLIAAIAEAKELDNMQTRSLAEAVAEKLGFETQGFVLKVLSLLPIKEDDVEVLGYLDSLLDD